VVGALQFGVARVAPPWRAAFDTLAAMLPAILLGAASLIAMVLAVMYVAKTLRKRGRAEIDRRFPAADVLLAETLAQSYGQQSRGATQARGNGALALTTGEIFFLLYVPERELRIPNKRKAWQAGIIVAIAVAVAALGLLPAAISFAAGVLASMALRTVPPRAVYEAIDWPVIVLLAAMIPVAGAMDSTGTADLIAGFMLDNVAQGHAVVGLALILVVSMFLSDLMNNAATAAVMCPIAIGTAAALGVNADSFLMAVAIGASCAFLTPIGHQNNTLILGPGGFRFGDYWKLGLPLEFLVIAVSLPMLLLVWPL